MENAIDAYPALRDVDPNRIALSTFVSMNNQLRLVRVTPKAWEKAIALLKNDDIVEISVLPPVFVSKEEEGVWYKPPARYNANFTPAVLSLSPDVNAQRLRRPNSVLGWFGKHI